MRPPWKCVAPSIVLLLVLALCACGDGDGARAAPAAYPRDRELRLNQIQVLGTHNSYHIQAPGPLFATLQRIDVALAESLEYTHLPLAEQFETEGIRQIELDVFADPDGGLYAMPTGLRLLTGDPTAKIPELLAPGFKVLHVQDLDFFTTCQTFVGCLEIVRGWSEAHPGHVPIMILVEAKDDPLTGIGVTEPVKIGTAELDALDAEIRSVFAAEEIITPDEVRGNHNTLEEAIRTDGWPTLGAARGRVLFTLDNGGAIRDAYIAGHPSLRGRILFTSSFPGEPEAGFIKLNDPIGDFDMIQEVVAQGFIVRTRADADTIQARTGDTMDREAALSSGAQFVSTDYPLPDPAFGTGYHVTIPGGMPARCNPVSAPPDCRATDVENPAYLSHE